MENKECNVLELEDGSSYIIFGKSSINDINYVCLVNEKDNTDILFQRISYETDPPKLFQIESEEEFNMLLKHFEEKYKDLFEQ